MGFWPITPSQLKWYLAHKYWYQSGHILKCDFNRTNFTYLRYKLSIRITYQMYLISNIGQESYWSNLLLRVWEPFAFQYGQILLEWDWWGVMADFWSPQMTLSRFGDTTTTDVANTSWWSLSSVHMVMNLLRKFGENKKENNNWKSVRLHWENKHNNGNGICDPPQLKDTLSSKAKRNGYQSACYRVVVSLLQVILAKLGSTRGRSRLGHTPGEHHLGRRKTPNAMNS